MDLYRKPLAGHWFQGNAGRTERYTPLSPYCIWTNFATFRRWRARPVPNERFYQSQNPGNPDRIRRRSGSPPCDGCGGPGDYSRRLAALRHASVSRAASSRAVRPAGDGASFPRPLNCRWNGRLLRRHKTIAKGETGERTIAWPDDLPPGIYRAYLTDAASLIEEVPLIGGAAKSVCRGFRPRLDARRPALRRTLGTQLGHGRFHRSRQPDRARARSGADGVGLNPLHALFDDRPGDCSPYSPNSRLFLNALYIDVEKLPEFRRAAGRERGDAPRLRQSETVDYVAVAGLKWRALRVRVRCLQGQGQRRAQGGFCKIPHRARPAAVALCLLRGAAAQIQDAVVGMAGGMAAA